MTRQTPLRLPHRALPRVHGLLLGAIVLGLPGCWISQAAYENALCKLDEDGDGDPRCGLSNTVTDGDCDDKNPYMSTLREETGTGELDDRGEDSGGAYDTLDNDCVGGDLLDVDGDGYAGITRADYEAKGGVWPTGQREEYDCHDLPIDGMPEGFEAEVNPGASEIWYDGIDGDCSGDDDYDQDGDGYVAREYADVYTGGKPATDCNDIDATISPLSDSEVFYDGEDQDCSADNDFDPDGDRHLTPGYNSDAATYVDSYGYEGESWVPWTPDSDCMDLDDSFGDVGPEITKALASTVYVRTPGDGECSVAEGTSCEVDYYDGIDSACDDIDSRGNVVFTEFDQDQDGYVRSSETDDRANFHDYVMRYAAFTNSRGEQPYREAMLDTFGDGSGNLTTASIDAWYDAHDNDCDDTDDTINPDAMEVLGDGIDQDCDGHVDTARFVYGDFSFVDPGPVRMGSTGAFHVLLVSATGGVDAADGFGLKLPRVFALSWDIDATTALDLTVDGTPYAVTKGSDVLHFPVHLRIWGERYISGISWASTRTRLQPQVSSQTTGFQVFNSTTPSSRTDVATYTSGDLRCDSVSCWQVGCDGDSLHWIQFDRSTSVTFSGDGVETGLDADQCFVLPSDLAGDSITRLYTVAADGTMSAWIDDLGLLTPADTDPLAGIDATFVRSHGEWLILGQSGGGLRLVRTPTEQATVLTGTTWVDADATVVDRSGTDFWAIAGIRSDNVVELAYGPSNSLTRVEFVVESEAGAVTPTAVAVTASEGRVMIAVRGTDSTERIGWTLLQTP